MSKPTDLVQGTLDLLILKTIALEPMHGWGIAQRIRQVSKEVLQVNQGALYPPSIAWSKVDGSRRSGASRTTIAGRSTTHLPPLVAGIWRRNRPTGKDSRAPLDWSWKRLEE